MLSRDVELAQAFDERLSTVESGPRVEHSGLQSVATQPYGQYNEKTNLHEIHVFQA
jgi:hypothetical protein